MIRRHIEIIVIDGSLHGGVVVEDEGRSRMPAQPRLAGARLHDAAIWREIALEDGQRTFLVNGIVDRADDIVIVNLRASDVFAQGPARHRETVEMQMPTDARHESWQSACEVEILHQVGCTARAHIRDHRNLAAGDLEIVEADIVTGPAGHGDQVDHGIRGAAHSHGDRDGVLVGGAGLDLARREILPHHLDSPATCLCAHADMIDVGGRDGGGTRQRHADRLRNRRHCASGAHGHAVAMAAGDAALDFHPIFLGNVAGPALIPVLPSIRPGAQGLALPVAAQHGTCRNID
jgi:hypothetical protein